MSICRGCGADDEIRLGYCWDCAVSGEERAAKRTVLQHFTKCVGHASRGFWTEARIDLRWAWERLTRTGNYKPGGEFSRYF